MAESNIERYETSVQDGVPIECYKFEYNKVRYLYTSAAEDIELEIKEQDTIRTEKFFAEYIKRAGVKPGGMGGPTDCVIRVSKDHAIAKLFQGPPPETPVDLTVYRLHLPDKRNYDVALKARIHQASFSGSECELIARQENWLSKELPNGMQQYYCNNVIFGQHCKLEEEKWRLDVLIDKVEGIDVFSEEFTKYEDGYFVGGKIYYDSFVRMIAAHKGNKISLKYPFMANPHNVVKILPGCDHLFKTCALRYQNTVNFTGCPYVPPTDPEKNPTGQGAYWIDSLVVQRDTDGFVGSISL